MWNKNKVGLDLGINAFEMTCHLHVYVECEMKSRLGSTGKCNIACEFKARSGLT